MDRLTLDMFAEHVGQKFRVVIDEENALEVELIEAKPIKSYIEEDDDENEGEDLRRDPFALVFRGPKETQLPQRMYLIEHPNQGNMPIFIVPIGKKKLGLLYEAIFN